MSDWRDLAACKGKTNVMFTTQGGRGRQQRWRNARAICNSCPVADVCLAAALLEEHGLPSCLRFGMRGGQAPSARLRIGTNRQQIEAKHAAELAAWPAKAEDCGKKTCGAEGCDERFRPHPKTPYQRFCCRRCCRRQRSIKERRLRGNPEQRVCEGCDETFRPHPKAPHTSTRFCSRRCQRAAQERRRRRESPEWRARQIARRRAAYLRDREYETARQRRYDRAKRAAREEAA